MDFDQIMQDEKRSRIVVDDKGQVQDISPRFSQNFGWQRDELVGKALSLIIPPALRDAHHLGFSRHFSTLQKHILEQHLELPIVHSSGKESQATHYITSGLFQGNRLYAAIIEPLTD